MKYTIEYYDDEDTWPSWCVVGWYANGIGKAFEHCRTEAEAESLVRAYNAIKLYEASAY